MAFELMLTFTLGGLGQKSNSNAGCTVANGLTIPAKLATGARTRNECMQDEKCGGAAMCENSTWKANASCPRIPTSMLWRGYERGTSPAHNVVVKNVHSWIREAQCNISRGERVRRLNVLVLGGSVTHGTSNSPGAQVYWTRRHDQAPLFDALLALLPADGAWWGSVSLEDIINVKGLPTSGMGPSYMAECVHRHVDFLFNGSHPDVAFLEYGVNDFGPRAEPMLVLIKNLLRVGTAVVVLHHFAPAFQNFEGNNGNQRMVLPLSAESKHAAVARLLGVSQLSVSRATGLGNRSAVTRVLHPCAFVCGFSSDHIHPTGCGHRFLAQMAAAALFDLIALPRVLPPQKGACRAEPRQCSELDVDVATSAVNVRIHPCAATPAAKCYSMAGPRESWNLKPTNSDSSSWRLLDLKASWKYSVGHPGHRIYKFIWEGRIANATAEFAIKCPTNTTGVRIMYLRSQRLRYGDGLISINGKQVGTLSGTSEKYTLFKGADFLVNDSHSKANRRHDLVGGLGDLYRYATRTSRPPPQPLDHVVMNVTLTVLANKTHGLQQRNSSNQTRGGQGFAVNSIICLESIGQGVYYLDGRLKTQE